MVASDAPAISTTANQVYFKSPYFRQNWSLPDSFIYYLAKNPNSSKCYQKLIQSCKYFFFKNPIIEFANLRFYGREDTSKMVIRKDGEYKYIDLKNLSQSFWITVDISVYSGEAAKENFISSLIPYIYQCDVKDLDLCNQIISFNELLFLASKADYLCLSECTVKNEDGTVASVEKIVEACVHVKIFEIYFKDNDPSISSKTVANLFKIPHLSTKKEINFSWIPEIFDIETFFTYMKKNKHTYFDLRFNDSISEAYKNRLEEIVAEIIETENHDFKPPLIDFDGLSLEQSRKLWSIAIKPISTTF